MTQHQHPAEIIRDTLKAVNVNDYKEQKGKFDYLSWTDAWEILTSHFPRSRYDIRFEYLNDSTVMTWCDLYITHRDVEVSYKMWLPVMDNRNNSIANPSSRAVSDGMMRCLTKAIAMAGLGFYIFQGEDLPTPEKEALLEKEQAAKAKIEPEQVEELFKLMAAAKLPSEKFCQAMGIAKIEDLTVGQLESAITRLNDRVAKIKETQS